MNWVGPNAPAHEPLRRSGLMSPRLRISKRGEEFVAEIGLAPADAGERRRRAHHRAVAARGAEIRFDSPDRGDHVPVDPIGLLDRVEGGAVLRQDFPAALDAVFADEEIEIVPERLGEFGLGVHQIHDAQVGRQSLGIGVEGRAGNAPPRGVRPQAFQAIAEVSCRGQDRFGGHERMAGTPGLAAPIGRTRGRRSLGRNRTRRPWQ